MGWIGLRDILRDMPWICANDKARRCHAIGPREANHIDALSWRHSGWICFPIALHLRVDFRQRKKRDGRGHHPSAGWLGSIRKKDQLHVVESGALSTA